MAFQKAQRTKVPLKIAFTGPAGAGKTMSALLLAMGMASSDDKVFFIDTENERARLYERLGGFMHTGISAPYAPQKYVDNFQEAIGAGAEVIVIDSMSHVWESDGGILSTKELLDARQGSNSFTNWAPAKKPLAKLMVLILDSKVDVIVCIRSKQEYVQEWDDKKKKNIVVKKGMAPIMQPGVEYEFVTLLELDHTHIPLVPKDMTETLYDINEPIGRKHGEMLRVWKEGGAQDTRAEPQDAQGGEEEEEPVTTPMLKWLGRVAAYLEKDWKAPENLTASDAKILYDMWNPQYLEAKKKAEEEAARQAKEQEELEASAAEAEELEQREAADIEAAQEEKKKSKK